MRGQESPAAAMQYGVFGFPDPSGARLITVPSLLRPAGLHTALCSGTRRFSVRFERRQTEREGYNGRRTPDNFDNLDGVIYAVLQGRIEPNAICFLAVDRFLSSAALLPAEPPAASNDCDPDARRRIASSRSRLAVSCRLLTKPQGDTRLVLVEFARQNNDALASVVLIDRDRASFADYPAVFRGEGQDLWRVGDGGVLSGLEVVFLVKRGNFYAMGIEWSAEEGALLALFVTVRDHQFRRVIEDYWYRAPA
jgi:hypothetical protein